MSSSTTTHNTYAPEMQGGNKLDRFVTDDEEIRPARQRPVTQPGAVDALITVQPLRKDEMQPSYAQDLGLDGIEYGCYGSMIDALGVCMGTLGSIPCCPCPNPYRPVQQGSVGLVSKFGKFYKSVDPGLVRVNPYSEKLRTVDIKIQIAAVPRQRVVTKDNVAVDIDSVIYYHIVNPYKASFGISDVRVALVERAQTTLRHVIGSRNLQSLLTDREAVASEIEEIVESVSDKWGVTVEALLLKDILFSEELQQSLSSAAQQRRLGESKVIAARAEVDAAKLMREAADILSSPAAIQIRQLESLQTMARTAQSKVIFVPMNLFNSEGGTGALTQAALLENVGASGSGR